jgi:uncharacterized iron-regulated protein
MAPRRSGAAAPTILALLLVACGHAPTAELRFEQPLVLLGEVHDNAAQHALRLQAFERALAAGARPALLMEQFDRDQQGVIDALRAKQPPPDADALIAAAGGTGWHWPYYRPFVALALRDGLPIVAVNVSRDEARKVMRDGLSASGFDADVPADIIDAQARSIQASHCGGVDAQLARRMALAQVARDQSMARAMQSYADRGVVLLAGNGHVRIDAGVPRWLSPRNRARSEAIGLLEQDVPDEGRFDRVLHTVAQPRPDPCAGRR